MRTLGIEIIKNIANIIKEVINTLLKYLLKKK